MFAYRQRFEEMVRLVESYPMCRVKQPANFGEPRARSEILALAESEKVPLSPALVEFYEEMDGFSFFWRVPEGLPETLYESYNASSEYCTAINWEGVHGIKIPPLMELLRPTEWGDLYVQERPHDIVVALAGRALSPSELAQCVRPFDRYAALGNEDACTGILMLPGQEERIVGITDSGLIDPRRPWMSGRDYLDLIIAMAGERGSRYELSGRASNIPPGALRFTPEELVTFRRSLFRPLTQGR